MGMCDSLGFYLDAIEDTEPMTQEEEAEIFDKLIKASDPEERKAIRSIIFEKNVRLVFTVCRKYFNMSTPGNDEDDMFQDGCIGLLTAIDRFDPSKGYKFSTYAYSWIFQGIGRGLSNNSSTIRMAAHMHEIGFRVFKALYEARIEFDEDCPTPEQILACIKDEKVTLNQVEDVLYYTALRNPDSLDAYVTEEEPLSKFIKDDNFDRDPALYAEMMHDCDEINAIVDDVIKDERDKDILRRRYGLYPYDDVYKLREIGEVYGITRERVRQIECKCLRALKKRLIMTGKLRKMDFVNTEESLPDDPEIRRVLYGALTKRQFSFLVQKFGWVPDDNCIVNEKLALNTDERFRIQSVIKELLGKNIYI